MARKELKKTKKWEDGTHTMATTQKKRTSTRQSTETQPAALLPSDAFAAALEAIPPDDWRRTWAAGRTIVLRRTSRKVKEVVDKMRLPAVVRLSRSFWNDTCNGTVAEKLQVVMRQLQFMTVRCGITTLELAHCEMKGQDAERVLGVLAQSPELAHLDLSKNRIGNGMAESFAALGPLAALAHLDLSYNRIFDAGTHRLAEGLEQCKALSHLHLGNKLLPRFDF